MDEFKIKTTRKTATLALMLGSALAVAAPFTGPAEAQGGGQIKTEHVRGNIYALFGMGGNIGVSIGDDGVFLIDDQFAPATAAVLAAIAEISDQPVRYLINTHYHGDHTGGNENLGKAGTLILAHDKLRARLMERPLGASGGWTGDGATYGLPVITFNDQLSLHLNGDEARATYVANAHTDGDSFIYFRGANVIHMGDLMFNGMYPYIDVDGGGNVDGVLAGYDRALAMANDETRFIPGHGPMAMKADLLANRAMIQTLRDRVAALIADGKSLEEVLAAAPSAEYDEEYASSSIDPTKMVTSVYRSLAE